MERLPSMQVGFTIPISFNEMIQRLGSFELCPTKTIFQNAGGYLHRAPDDQSNCDHLGTVMKGASTIRDGRCDFYELLEKTHRNWMSFPEAVCIFAREYIDFLYRLNYSICAMHFFIF